LKRTLFMMPVLLLLAFPLIAEEQEIPQNEIYGGYQVLGDIFFSNLMGAKAEIIHNFTPYIGIVGEFGFGLENETRGLLGSFHNTDSKEFIFLAGPRLSYNIHRFRLFAHGLAGGTVQTGNPQFVEFSKGNLSGVAMAGGLGIEISVNKRIAIRPVELDLLSSRYNRPAYQGGNIVEDSIRWAHQLRYSGGITFKLTSK
jgi:hypothetical protein